MRFAITVLGWNVLTIELGAPTDDDLLTDQQDGGYLTSTPITFVSAHELPDGSGLPYREGWDE